jgi:hypothetical protein
VIALARIAARESAPAYAALGAALGLAAALAAFGAGGEFGPEARARLAAGYLAGTLEALSGAAAVFAVAFTLPRDLAAGRAATVLVRPVGPAAFLAGRAAGAVAAAAAAVLAAFAALGLALLALGGGGAVRALAPRPALEPARVELPGPGGEPLPASGRFGLASGSEAIWRFEGIPAGRAERLEIAPAYALAAGSPSPVDVRVLLRGEAADRALGPVDLGAITVPARRAAEMALPPAFAGAHALELLLEVETPDAVLGFEPHGPNGVAVVLAPASLALAAAEAAAGMLVEAAFLAALAALGASFLSAFPAALFAGGLGLAARFPLLLRTFQASALAGAVHVHGEAPAVPLGPPSLALRGLQGFADAVAALLPDLSRLDLAGPIAAGRVPALADLARAAAGAAPCAAVALVLGAILLRAREPGRGRP